MPYREVGTEPPDHTPDRTRLVGLEAGEACWRSSHELQLSLGSLPDFSGLLLVRASPSTACLTLLPTADCR